MNLLEPCDRPDGSRGWGWGADSTCYKSRQEAERHKFVGDASYEQLLQQGIREQIDANKKL
jgi:hypothetical protein